MSKFITSALLATLAASTALSANAEVEASANIAITSDYHWRGMTQTNQDMAVQGGFDLAYGGLYVGTWASNVDFGDATDTNAEIDFYGGYAGEAGGVGYDVGVVYYTYPDSSDTDLDFVEIYGSLSKAFGAAEISGGLAVDPDNETVYTNAGISFGLSDAFSIDAGLGQYLDGGDGLYAEELDYTIGGTYSVEGFDFDLRHYAKEEGDDNIVFTISKSM